MNKLFIIIILLISVCTDAKTKHPPFMKSMYRVSYDSIEGVSATVSKEESYKIYLDDCNTIVRDTIRETGYINFDTIRVRSIPEDLMYFNKPVIQSVQISPGIANIIVADTIWSVTEVPEYRSTWDYYVLAKNPMPNVNKINSDYSNKIVVFRNRVYTWKKRKPLIFQEWDKYRSKFSNHLEIY